MRTKSFAAAEEKLDQVLRQSARKGHYLSQILHHLELAPTLEIGTPGTEASDLAFMCRNLRQAAAEWKEQGSNGPSRRKRGGNKSSSNNKSSSRSSSSSSSSSSRSSSKGPRLPVSRGDNGPIAVVAETHGRVSMVSSLCREQLNLAKRLCLESCRFPEKLLELYMRNGLYDDAVQLVVREKLQPRMFHEFVLVPSMGTRRLAGTVGFQDCGSDLDVLLQCMETAAAPRVQRRLRREDGRRRWLPCVRVSCKRLGGMLRAVYKLQLFAEDHVGAVLTCVEFATQANMPWELREQWYEQAEKHLKAIEEIDREAGSVANSTTPAVTATPAAAAAAGGGGGGAQSGAEGGGETMTVAQVLQANIAVLAEVSQPLLYPGPRTGGLLEVGTRKSREEATLLRVKVQWQRMAAEAFHGHFEAARASGTAQSGDEEAMERALQLNVFRSTKAAQALAVEWLSKATADQSTVFQNVVAMIRKLKLSMVSIFAEASERLSEASEVRCALSTGEREQRGCV